MTSNPAPIATTGSSAASSTYKIFYSSRDDSLKMWCPDCTRVESHLGSIFAATDPTSAAPARPSVAASQLPEAAKQRPDADIVYVGSKEEWRSGKNDIKQKFGLKVVPTVLKFNGEKEVGRIEEDDILNNGKMGSFLES